jgi:hypothetical protein
MAGKFLSLEEVAQRLGVGTDEVNRFVDRKQLFPMRDGASLKFRTDDVERLVADLADEGESGSSGTLELDLDDLGDGPTTGGPASSPSATGGPGGDVLELDDGELEFGEVEASSGLSFAGGPAEKGDGAEALSGLVLESDLLGGDGVSGSGPSTGGAARGDAGPAGSGLDLGEVELGGEADATLELPGLEGSDLVGGLDVDPLGGSAPSGIGSALSGPLESGISLEDGDLKMSGIDLEEDAGGSAPAAASGFESVGGLEGGALDGDEFDLGGTGSDEASSEQAAVGDSFDAGLDSSFFNQSSQDSASVSFDDGGDGDAIAGGLPVDLAMVADTTFTTLQIVGLVCLSLLLLLSGLVMLDLVWAIRSSGTAPLSAPLLDGLTRLFGWSR